MTELETCTRRGISRTCTLRESLILSEWNQTYMTCSTKRHSVVIGDWCTSYFTRHHWVSIGFFSDEFSAHRIILRVFLVNRHYCSGCMVWKFLLEYPRNISFLFLYLWYCSNSKYLYVALFGNRTFNYFQVPVLWAETVF